MGSHQREKTGIGNRVVSKVKTQARLRKTSSRVGHIVVGEPSGLQPQYKEVSENKP